MKKLLLAVIGVFCSQMISFSEEIHFDNETYKLKFSAIAPQTQGYGNEYFKGVENVSNWTKMIGVYHYPKESNPLEFVQNFDKTIDATDNSILLKLVENKKANQAIISFLTNNCENGKKYFEYDVYKFEKHPEKGMLVSKYASKHFFTNESEITKLAQKIKEDNDKYLELLIVSAKPVLIENDITSEK